MRLGPASQQALALAKQRRETKRIKIGDATDTLVDVSDWFVDGVISDNVDQFGPTADLRMHRELDGSSMAPLVSNMVAGGRRITVESALSNLGEAPVENDFQLLFDGRIDDPMWGGAGSALTLPCRSRITRLLHDRWVEIPFEVPEGTQPAVMQYIMDEVMGAEAPTLQVIGTPTAGINTFEQRRQSVMEALRAVTGANGWLVREIWNDAAGEFQLTLFDPDRDKTTADYGYNSSDYYSIDDIRQQTLGVRSVVIIEWEAGLYGFAEDQEAIDTPGIGRKVMYINAIGSPFITSQEQAQTLAELALKDVSSPLPSHTARHALDYRVEVGDVYTWLGNGVHYDSTLQLAVTGYEHRLSGNPGEPSVTVIRGRGRPSGGTYRWYEQDERTRTRDELGVPDDEEPGEEPPVLPSGDWWYTQPAASEGFELEAERDESLGGYFSITRQSEAFRAVTEDELTNGVTLYRCWGLANTHEMLTWEAVRTYLPDLTLPANVTIDIGLDPAGVVTANSATVQGEVVVDEETAPTGVTFSAPTDVASGLVVGNLEPNQGILVWVRMTVSAGATEAPEAVTVCATTCTPSEA